MLRYALRRALWILPALLVATLLYFGLLTHQARPADDPRLPLFVNTHPRDVRALSAQALSELTEGPNDGAAQELVRLGGAALPHVLPHLDALGPEARGRLAVALQPVAERMGLASPAAFSTPESAVTFWTRFWEERAVDFRPAVVRRAVHRQATHGSLARRAVLVELDTYALDGLMDALGPCKTPDDVARAARLLSVASHVTGRDACVHPGMSPGEAAPCVVRWREWWLTSRVDYETLSGPERVAAILTETQYGRWALQALTLRLGVGPDGVTVLDRLRTQGPRTLGLALLALVLAYGVAFPLGLISARCHRGAIDQGASILTLALLALPVPLLTACFAVFAGGKFALAAAVTATAAGLVSAPSRHQRIAAIEELSHESLRYAKAKGIPASRLLLVHVGRPVGALAVTLAALDFPLAMSAACVVEQAFQLPGLGPHLVRAVLDHDIALLMAFGIVATALHALLLLASDVAGGWLDPRLNRAFHGENT
jgi:ABC-type dipeptide/oligopeptide/nickel transport system permease component